MSKKYIAQINNTNFVYPNYKLAEYDVEIIHELKENSVSGITSGFSILYNSGTGNLQLSFTYQWYLNSAEPFISNDGKLNILSVHMMTNDKKYFKPWICVGLIQDNNPSLSYKTDTQNFVITPAMVGQASFTDGTYFVEIRMMGHRAIFPLNYSDVVSGIATPTPTPTNTPTHTPTATPTPTPTPTPSGGGGSYNYYEVTRYTCPSCTSPLGGLVARVTNPVTLITGNYYNNGDGYVYLVDGYNAGPSYTINLDGSNSSGTNCLLTCMI
jgi:hypothetical protein